MATTILGGQGFIGRHLASALCKRGEQCWIPRREDPEIFTRPLGTVFYCIGITADFRHRPYDTVTAHVSVLGQILKQASFDQLLYLSSTRVYANSLITLETQPISVSTFHADDLYNISKLMGESLALSANRKCRVVRLSNVLGHCMGPTNFVGTLLAEAAQSGAVNFQTSLASEKDYIWVDDAVNGLIEISQKGKRPIYNLAFGKNVCHGEFANILAQNGVKVNVLADAVTTRSHPIVIDNFVTDTGFRPSSIVPQLRELIKKALV